MQQTKKTRKIAAMIGLTLLLGIAGPGWAESSLISHLRQIAPMRQDSVRVPSPAELPNAAPSMPTTSPNTAPFGSTMEGMSAAPPPPVGGYDPAGRRDPFTPVLSQLAPGQMDPTLPPLQRVNLTDMNLIAIIWGAYGYTAMVQTPDGNGYTVRKGTRVGPNSGVVSAVTEKGIIVQERFTDVYGRKQEREYVKLLHPKEGLE